MLILLATDQPEQLVFTDRLGRIIGDSKIPGVDDYHNELDDDVELPGVDGAEVAGTNQNSQQPIEITDDLDTNTGDPPLVDPNNAVPPEQPGDVMPAAAPPAPPVIPPPNEIQQDPVVPLGVRRSTRARTQAKRYTPSLTGQKYDYVSAQLEDGVLHPDAHMFAQEEFYQSEPDIVAYIMTQLLLKAGLKEWGEQAELAAHSEMKQLHMRNTFKPKHWKELTNEQRQTVLESHMFLKEKRSGKIKGRTVAGGNKQCGFIAKEDASLPTVATESVLLTCIVDAEEGRDVAVIDIPNAFIQTRIEDEADMAFIKIRGILVDMLVDIAPDVYKNYVYYDKKGVKQLLVQCQNAIYGTMVASLLYYRKFTKSLLSTGFEINPYDPCVANKVVDGKQMTICFHVDDCKLSHVDSTANDDMIDWLKREYESIFEDGSGEMVVTRGKVHNYLGMKLDYSTPGRVIVSMFDYVDEIISAFEKADPTQTGTKTSAAPSDLFKVDEACKKLKSTRMVEFHNLVAKTLYATKRARPDTCTAIAFLTTRVKAPDINDWSKLVHLMKYLRGTRKLPLILSADGSGILKWWVDASFAVHPNMRGHSGGGLSLGRGFPLVSSTKQKLNTRSSTETEVVGADDFMAAILWTRYFMEAQGYAVRDNLLFQDNKSAILLEKNGKLSSSKRTKHINVRYFFISDRVAKGDLKIEWCPTGDMIGDFMTKPVQGALFKKFRNFIMGVIPVKESGNKDSKVKQSLASSQGKDRRHRSVLEKRANREEAKRTTSKRETHGQPQSKAIKERLARSKRIESNGS